MNQEKDKVYVLDTVEELKNLMSRKSDYTRASNILMNHRGKDWYPAEQGSHGMGYTEIGNYICQTMDISSIPQLASLADRVNDKSIAARLKDFWSGQRERTLSSVGIFFLTAVLDADALRKMFGEPIYHDEFGEGFEGEYNEETDEYGEPDIKQLHASYFLKVGGERLHIGYDHRGTGIDFAVAEKGSVLDGYWTSNSQIPDKLAERCFETIKKLVDIYAEKCL